MSQHEKLSEALKSFEAYRESRLVPSSFLAALKDLRDVVNTPAASDWRRGFNAMRTRAISIADGYCRDVPERVDVEADKNAFAAGYLCAAGGIRDALKRNAEPPAVTEAGEQAELDRVLAEARRDDPIGVRLTELALERMDRETAPPSTPEVIEQRGQDQFKKLAAQVIDTVVKSPCVVETRFFSQPEAAGRLENDVVAILSRFFGNEQESAGVSPASVAPASPSPAEPLLTARTNAIKECVAMVHAIFNNVVSISKAELVAALMSLLTSNPVVANTDDEDGRTKI